MHNGEGQRFPRNDFMYSGAIFMSNRKTKKECLKRQLFGLPSSQAGFMKKLKAGMLLFLFEHEERKLYGVFEAMCDGSLNIVPDAFSSSGMSFPAQIRFKRIWMCKPLVEDEFRDAIKENYYTSQKFNFGLSYEQVYRLLHLFNSKKINLEQNQEPGTPNDVIQAYEKSNIDLPVPSKNRFSFQAGVHNIDDSLDSSNRSGHFSRDMGQSIFDKRQVAGQSKDKRREIGLGNFLPDNVPPDHCTVQGLANELLPAALDIYPSLAQQYTIFDKRPEVVFENSLRCNILPGYGAVQGSVNELRPVGLGIHPLTSRLVTKEGMTSSSVFSSNISHGCSKVSHHEELWEGSSPQKDGSVETGESSRLPNILLKTECDVPQKCEEDNKDSEPDQRLRDGCYPLLQSDVDQMRKSVFSRLSNPKPSKNAQACELDKNLSQLLETLTERRNQWSMKAEVNWMQGNMYVSNSLISEGRDQRSMETEVKQMQHNLVSRPSISERGDKMRVQSMQDNLSAEKPLVDTSGAEEKDMAAALSSCKMFVEEVVQLPFVNFKRKKAHEFERVAEIKNHVVNGDRGRQYTRRRLVRPSFSEEDHGGDMNCPSETKRDIIVASTGQVGNLGTAMLIDESQSLRSGVPDGSLTLASPGSGVPDGASTWVRQETMLAQVNASGVVPEDEELKALPSGVVPEDEKLKGSNASEETMLAQANASGVVPEDEELKGSNASEAVSNCEAFIPPVHSGAGALGFDQHDYLSPVSPAKRKGAEIAELSPKRRCTSQEGGIASEPLNNCEASAKVPLWLQLKSITAKLKR